MAVIVLKLIGTVRFLFLLPSWRKNYLYWLVLYRSNTQTVKLDTSLEYNRMAHLSIDDQWWFQFEHQNPASTCWSLTWLFCVPVSYNINLVEFKPLGLTLPPFLMTLEDSRPSNQLFSSKVTLPVKDNLCHLIHVFLWLSDWGGSKGKIIRRLNSLPILSLSKRKKKKEEKTMVLHLLLELPHFCVKRRQKGGQINAPENIYFKNNQQKQIEVEIWVRRVWVWQVWYQNLRLSLVRKTRSVSDNMFELLV